jgi:gliding motility-associated-like protein
MRQSIKKILLFLLLSYTISSYAQNSVLSIVQGDSINLPCAANCTTLKAQYPKVNKTTSYTAGSIPFAPTAISGASNLSLSADDFFSDTIPLGFSFCFYNTVYNKVCISDNGQITFNTSYALNAASFATQDLLPTYNSSFPDLAIFGPMIDAKLSLGGSIKYATVGVAPFRKFIVKYDAVPYFNNNCGGTVTSTFQIELLETYNEVQCHISNKPVCNTATTNWLNYATLGIQGTAATGAVTAVGKNASVWTATNEAYAFTPSGPPAFLVNWFNFTAGGPSLSNTDSLSICFFGRTKIKCIVSYDCPAVTYEDSIVVIVPQPVIDSISVLQPFCATDTNGCATIYASGSGPFTYTVSNQSFQTSSTICGLGTGVNLFYVKDVNGCVGNKNLLITPVSKPKIMLDSTKAENCPLEDGFAYVHTITGVAPYTYVWDNGDTGSVLSNVAGDAYYLVTVTDAAGCTTAGQVYVPATGLPKPVLQITKPTCALTNGFVTVSAPSGSGPFSYVWTGGTNTTNTFGLAAAGTYSVKVTAANSCDTTIFMVLLDTLTTVLNAVPSTTKCGLNNGVLSATAINGLPPYQFYLNNVVGVPPFTGLAAGTYTVKVVDSNGCTKLTIRTIAASLGPTINFLSANAHCDSNNGTATIVPINAINPITYTWANGQTTSTAVGLAPFQNYVATIKDSNNCIVSDTIYIDDDGSPVLSILSFQQPSCYGFKDGSVTLSGTSGISPYKYSVDTVNFSAVAQIGGIGGGAYNIFIKDGSGCIRDTVVNFAQPDSMFAVFTQPADLVCYDDISEDFAFGVVGGKPPYDFELISTNGGALANSTVSNLKGGTHLVKVSDITGCKDTFEIIINQPPAALSVEASTQDVPCYQASGGSIDLIIEGGWGTNTIAWALYPQFNNNASIKDLSKNKYEVTVTDIKGCAVNKIFEVEQLYCCEAYVPSAFTPNGDNVNSTLKILTQSNIFQVRFKVFNRWGNEVFSSLDVQSEWDGTFNGQPCSMDTYFYLLEFNCTELKNKVYMKGDVQLIR